MMDKIHKVDDSKCVCLVCSVSVCIKDSMHDLRLSEYTDTQYNTHICTAGMVKLA
jgi:hypothetical protein